MTGKVKRPVVYLDACFVSHLAGQDLDDPLQAERHEMSVAWWRRMSEKVRLVVSYLVWAEISKGKNAGDALQRGEMISGMELWPPCAEADALADALLDSGAVKRKKDNDAMHIALASVGGADVLLSWNFQDIVNERKLPLIKIVVEQAGYRCPLLVSPKDQLEAMP
jgi:predicted nucleic acid-binding protein